MRGAAARNVLKAWLLVGLLAAVFAGVGWLLADTRGAVLFAFCSVLGATAAYTVGDRALLGMLGARPFALAEDPMLRSTADRIAAQLQLAPPKLQLLDDTFPRAFVVGRGPRSATLAVSAGLLTALPPSVLGVLEADRSTGSFSPLSNATLGEWELPTDHAVNGSRTLSIVVSPN